MSDETNPKNGHDFQAETAAPARPPTALEALDAMLGPLLFCMARGALALLGQMPGQVVLIALCRVMGKLMGELYIGDEIAVRTFRGECRKAFKTAIMEAPIQGFPAAASPLQTTPPRPAAPSVKA